MVARERLIASAIPFKSPRSSVTPALSMATSVPVPMAIPTCAAASAGPPGSAPLDWRLFLCLTQLWIGKTGQSFPPCASTLLQYLGQSPNHQHQISLAQFSAYHLNGVIRNLDWLSIARTTKLTVASKDKVENETVDHSVDQGCFVPNRVAFYQPLVRQQV